MPAYEFQCSNDECDSNLRVEKELRFHEPHQIECPLCGEIMQKIYSSNPVIFKSKGFYSTDK